MDDISSTVPQSLPRFVGPSANSPAVFYWVSPPFYECGSQAMSPSVSAEPHLYSSMNTHGTHLQAHDLYAEAMVTQTHSLRNSVDS